MRYLFALIFLAACDNSPQWEMRAAEQTRLQIDGHDYAIYRLDRDFEVIRYGYAPRSQRAEIIATMLEAVRQVTGCTPNVRQGDSGEMRGTLTACPRSRS